MSCPLVFNAASWATEIDHKICVLTCIVLFEVAERARVLQDQNLRGFSAKLVCFCISADLQQDKFIVSPGGNKGKSLAVVRHLHRAGYRVVLLEVHT